MAQPLMAFDQRKEGCSFKQVFKGKNGQRQKMKKKRNKGTERVGNRSMDQLQTGNRIRETELLRTCKLNREM